MTEVFEPRVTVDELSRRGRAYFTRVVLANALIAAVIVLSLGLLPGETAKAVAALAVLLAVPLEIMAVGWLIAGLATRNHARRQGFPPVLRLSAAGVEMRAGSGTYNIMLPWEAVRRAYVFRPRRGPRMRLLCLDVDDPKQWVGPDQWRAVDRTKGMVPTPFAIPLKQLGAGLDVLAERVQLHSGGHVHLDR